MRTEFDFIYFENVTPYDGRKTQVWDCRNKKSGDKLGQISWYGPWRQYVFYTVSDIVLSAGCLEDIRDFIKQLVAARKQTAEERMLIARKLEPRARLLVRPQEPPMT